jgi:hypothetical protein
MIKVIVSIIGKLKKRNMIKIIKNTAVIIIFAAIYTAGAIVGFAGGYYLWNLI